MATDCDAAAGAGLASRLMSRWMLPGMLRRQSMCALIPDPRVLERGFHGVTIVDMGDLSEPSLSLDDLSLLRRQWPVTVLRRMVWLQQDLDMMRAVAKKRFRNSRPWGLFLLWEVD